MENHMVTDRPEPTDAELYYLMCNTPSLWTEWMRHLAKLPPLTGEEIVALNGGQPEAAHAPS